MDNFHLVRAKKKKTKQNISKQNCIDGEKNYLGLLHCLLSSDLCYTVVFIRCFVEKLRGNKTVSLNQKNSEHLRRKEERK